MINRLLISSHYVRTRHGVTLSSPVSRPVCVEVGSSSKGEAVLTNLLILFVATSPVLCCFLVNSGRGTQTEVTVTQRCHLKGQRCGGNSRL